MTAIRRAAAVDQLAAIAEALTAIEAISPPDGPRHAAITAEIEGFCAAVPAMTRPRAAR